MSPYPGRTVAPPYVADERTTLDAWLDFHRETLLWKCDGLDDEQLRTASCPPSNLTLLGLVRHMAEVERGWFRGFAKDDTTDIYSTSEDPDADADFDLVDDADVAADLETFRAEVEACRRLVAHRNLDEVETLYHERRFSLRWIYTHMIEEYARHNGHADLLRERIDGATGD